MNKKAVIKKMKTLNITTAFLIFMTVVLASCSTPRRLTSDVKPMEVSEVLKIEAISYISLIEKGNMMTHNDSLSAIAQMALDKSVEQLREELRLSSDEIIISDLFDYEQLEEEILFLIRSLENSRDVRDVAITSSLEFLLSGNGKRFGLIVVQKGFARTGGNYRGQIAKNIGLGIATGLLTGVATYRTPMKSNSTLYAIIVDNQEKNVAFFNQSWQEKDPTKQENITTQLKRTFEKYFSRK